MHNDIFQKREYACQFGKTSTLPDCPVTRQRGGNCGAVYGMLPFVAFAGGGFVTTGATFVAGVMVIGSTGFVLPPVMVTPSHQDVPGRLPADEST